MADLGTGTSGGGVGRKPADSRESTWLDLCWRAVVAEERKLYPAVEIILKNRVSSPEAVAFVADGYRYHAIRALLFEEAGRWADARNHAREALVAKGAAHEGYRFHPRPGLVQDEDARIDARLLALVS